MSYRKCLALKHSKNCVCLRCRAARPLPDEARRIILAARTFLGTDLEGGSLTDLLLDNMPSLSTVAQARALLREIGEGN